MKHTTLSLIALLALGCSETGTGTLRVSANGEEAAEAGYPLTIDGETVALADGFSIAFTHVYVGLSHFALETSSGTSAELVVDPVVVDLHGGPVTLWEASLPARRYEQVSYRTAVPSPSDRRLGGVDADAVAHMHAEGYAIYVIGVASHEGDDFSFAFGFPPIANVRCENGPGTRTGVVMRPNGITEAAITLHLDHIFFDSLAADEPEMRFEAFAAAAVEGHVTNAYLTQDVADLRDREGEPLMNEDGVLVYDPGPYPIDPTTLEQYLRAAGRTMGHFEGEGHCVYEDY